jgi:hypothetical protein
LLIGAIGPSTVALFIVVPLKGMPIAAGWDPKLIVWRADSQWRLG